MARAAYYVKTKKQKKENLIFSCVQQPIPNQVEEENNTGKWRVHVKMKYILTQIEAYKMQDIQLLFRLFSQMISTLTLVRRVLDVGDPKV